MKEYFGCNYNDDGCNYDRPFPSEILDAKPTKRLQTEFSECYKELIRDLANEYFMGTDDWSDAEWEDFEEMARG